MAVVGVPGWIGESAAQETGQRWMYQAGQALRITPPFWMSQMAGQSVYNITVTIAERFYNNTRIRGAWRYGTKNWINAADKGTVVGNVLGGSNNVGTFAAVQNFPSNSSLTIVDGPNKVMTVTMDDGAVFTFNPTDKFGNWNGRSCRNYDSTNIKGFYDYLNARVGQTRMGLMT
jgi:hypothetical protein